MLPQAGEVLHLTRAASVQFAVPVLFRVIRVHPWETYIGWVWLDGYELNAAGDAVERRSVFVQIAGLRTVGEAPDRRNPSIRNSRQPTPVAPSRSGNSTGQRSLPQQRHTPANRM
jgi:hypothetical protein